MLIIWHEIAINSTDYKKNPYILNPSGHDGTIDVEGEPLSGRGAFPDTTTLFFQNDQRSLVWRKSSRREWSSSCLLSCSSAAARLIFHTWMRQRAAGKRRQDDRPDREDGKNSERRAHWRRDIARAVRCCTDDRSRTGSGPLLQKKGKQVVLPWIDPYLLAQLCIIVMWGVEWIKNTFLIH